VKCPCPAARVQVHFLHLQIEEKRDDQGRKVKRETMVFPRYHQLQAVRRIESAARAEGPGNNYVKRTGLFV
jgi:type I restriction enzyme, R subunit